MLANQNLLIVTMEVTGVRVEVGSVKGQPFQAFQSGTCVCVCECGSVRLLFKGLPF